jgi:O-antigen/teichoic acid export membrane protein
MHPIALIKQLGKNDFLRDISKLSFGTLFGRLIAVAALPIATRLYSPEDFTLLSTYLAIVNVIASVACLRLEIAIPTVATHKEAAHLFILSLCTVLAISSILLLLTIAFPETIIEIIGIPDLAPFLWILPLGVLMSAGYSACQYWATRAKRFHSIAITRVTQSATGVSVMLGLGWLAITPLGLLLGNMLQSGAGVLKLGHQAFTHDSKLFNKVSFKGMRTTLHKNYRYPLYSVPECLLNVAGLQIPILLIAAHAGEEAGYLLLAMQVMYIPMNLLGGSIAQVYLSRAPEKQKAGQLQSFTVSIMRQLAKIGIVPFFVIGIAAPMLFPLFFGDNWLRAGEIAQWLAPWMVLQFIASPVSMAIYIKNQYRLMLTLTLFGFLIRVVPVLLATILALKTYLIIAFILGSILYYIAVFFTVSYSVQSKTEHFLKSN